VDSTPNQYRLEPACANAVAVHTADPCPVADPGICDSDIDISANTHAIPDQYDVYPANRYTGPITDEHTRSGPNRDIDPTDQYTGGTTDAYSHANYPTAAAANRYTGSTQFVISKDFAMTDHCRDGLETVRSYI
jgi:hypothetical protein